jgi:hypothetical protein
VSAALPAKLSQQEHDAANVATLLAGPCNIPAWHCASSESGSYLLFSQSVSSPVSDSTCGTPLPCVPAHWVCTAAQHATYQKRKASAHSKYEYLTFTCLLLLVLLCRFGQLQAVDVSGVQPAVHARHEGNVLRQDEPATYANRCGRAYSIG